MQNADTTTPDTKMSLPDKIAEQIQALKSKDANTRLFAAEALGEAADARAVPLLITALNDLYPEVRACAAAGLGRIGDTRAVPALLARVDDTHEVHVYVADALGEIGDVRAVPVLVTFLADNSMECTRRAAEALARIGVPAISAILEMYQTEEGLACDLDMALHVFGSAFEIRTLILTDERLTPAQKLTMLEMLWQCRQLRPLLTRRDRDIRNACERIANDSHHDSALRAGARSILIELDQHQIEQNHRRSHRHLLRASYGRAAGSEDDLLRIASADATAREDLLKPSDDPGSPSQRKPSLYSRMATGCLFVWRRLFGRSSE